MATAKRRVFLRKYGTEETTKPLSRREQIALMMLPPGKVLVEIGCGRGGLLNLSAAKFECAIGLELILPRLRHALKSDHAPNIEVLLVDMDEGLPFRDSSVSCVISVATFEYAYDPFSWLDEVRRVLDPKGCLVLQVANLVWLPRRIRLLFGRLPPTGSPSMMLDRAWNGGYLHSYTLYELRALLDACGFETVQLRSSGQFGTLARLWPSLFASDFVIRCDKR